MSIATSRNRAALEEQIVAWKAEELTIGFVPTMGFLHDGHLSLIKIAQQHTDKTIASIYVNPTQFAPHEDFDSYPRDEKKDLGLLEEIGTDLVYFPQVDGLYPDGVKVTVQAGKAADGLESDFRPHFFHGVCSVVSALFDHVTPDIAVFGEKDFQQLMVIREMVAAQNRNIEIIGGPIGRDEHGLALSSRNAYLREEELEIARQLNKVLRKHANLLSSRPTIGSGEILDQKDIQRSLNYARDDIEKAGFDKIDYVEMRWSRILAAGWVGKTRLIDNMPVREC